MTKIIAHRGYREANFPENSIPAFQEAIKKGASGFEFDIQLTSDKKLVCYHDANLGDNDNSLIEDKSLEYIKQHDLGEGVRIPTLDEIFSEFGNKTFLNLEIKAENVQVFKADEMFVK